MISEPGMGIANLTRSGFIQQLNLFFLIHRGNYTLQFEKF
jgi:hypothetical protein